MSVQSILKDIQRHLVDNLEPLDVLPYLDMYEPDVEKIKNVVPVSVRGTFFKKKMQKKMWPKPE